MQKQYKIVILGDGGSGKTAFVKKILEGDRNEIPYEFEKRYLATLGVEVYSFKYNENVEFSIWDTAGQEKFGGLKQGYYEMADAAIIFYDTTSKITGRNVNFWVGEIRK